MEICPARRIDFILPDLPTIIEIVVVAGGVKLDIAGYYGCIVNHDIVMRDRENKLRSKIRTQIVEVVKFVDHSTSTILRSQKRTLLAYWLRGTGDDITIDGDGIFLLGHGDVSSEFRPHVWPKI